MILEGVAVRPSVTADGKLLMSASGAQVSLAWGLTPEGAVALMEEIATCLEQSAWVLERNKAKAAKAAVKKALEPTPAAPVEAKTNGATAPEVPAA